MTLIPDINQDLLADIGYYEIKQMQRDAMQQLTKLQAQQLAEGNVALVRHFPKVRRAWALTLALRRLEEVRDQPSRPQLRGL